MKMNQGPIRFNKVNGWLSTQLAACIGIGICAPALLWAWPNPYQYLIHSGTGRWSIITAAWATAAAVLIIRRMTVFPGASVARSILPAFVSTFGIAIVALLVLRLPYSSSILGLAFAGSLAVRFLIDAATQRAPLLSYYVVPGGNVDLVLPLLAGRFIKMRGAAVPPRAAAIIADLHFDHDDDWERMLAEAALSNVPVYHYKQVLEMLSGRVRIEHLSENSLGALLPNLSYRTAKRATDTLFALLLIPLLALPFAIVAVMITLDSPGPVFFRQARVGYGGKLFHVIKFRTMRTTTHAVTDGETLHAAMTKEEDPRITRIGHILRRTRIDELPQIINVLRGEMSWIGPRPEAEPLSRWYQQEIPFYAYRHIVRPGITGWAQVNQGHVTNIDDITAKLQYDFYYIKNFSYWLDLAIAFRTILVISTGFGAK